MKGLIIKESWGRLILDGKKTIELRGCPVKYRGTIGLVFSGTKKVFSTVDIVDCILLDKESYDKNKKRHMYPYSFEDISYKKTYGWILENPVIFDSPKKYNHKLGCVIWVNLDQLDI